MRDLLPLRRAFLARLDAVPELGRRFLRGTLAVGAPGTPPEEFEGHRPYFPGDDVRWIDWNLYARQEELSVKVFRADEEVEVALLVDASASMTGGDGDKYGVAAAAAAALARLALISGHPVRVGRYAGRLIDLHGPWRAPDEIAGIQRLLALPPEAGAGTDLGSALRQVLAGGGRPASVVALTDGFQDQPLVSAASLALARGARRVAVVRIADPRDLAPSLRGHTLLRDPEGPERVALIADRDLEREARRRIAGHLEALRDACARVGAAVHELAARGDFEEAFLGMLRFPVLGAPGARAS
jgi:uncharacterized protein (DUF58 family)